MQKRVYVTLAAVLVAISGCGDSDEKEDIKPGTGVPNLPTKARARPTPTPPKVKAGPVPKVLGRAESIAEDLVDFARAKKRAKVVAEANELRSLVQRRVTATLEKAKVDEFLVFDLAGAAQSTAQIAGHGDFLQIALAANQVSGLMPHLYAYYSGPVPPAVLKLDYLEREAELRSLARDRALTVRAVDELASTWNELRSAVGEAGGGQVAARYSDHVEKMRELAKGFNRPAIRKEAGTGLRLVDELEGMFRRK